jgi:hypothetical protein
MDHGYISAVRQGVDVLCPVFLENFAFALDGRIVGLSLDLVVAETSVLHPWEWMDTIGHALALMAGALSVPSVGFFAFEFAAGFWRLEDSGFRGRPVRSRFDGFPFDGLGTGHGCRIPT